MVYPTRNEWEQAGPTLNRPLFSQVFDLSPKMWCFSVPRSSCCTCSNVPLRVFDFRVLPLFLPPIYISYPFPLSSPIPFLFRAVSFLPVPRSSRSVPCSRRAQKWKLTPQWLDLNKLTCDLLPRPHLYICVTFFTWSQSAGPGLYVLVRFTANDLLIFVLYSHVYCSSSVYSIRSSSYTYYTILVSLASFLILFTSGHICLFRM